MSKRKKVDPSPEDEEDDDDDSRGKSRQQEPQKVYDFHKKTIEVYPERLRELNRQFQSSISTQITSEPYSVLVGNCLDYVRQYFVYEDDLLKYSPWLAARLKQSRSDIVNCLQNTIDVYEALAHQDFDRLFEKITLETPSSTDKADSSVHLCPPATTSSSLPSVNLTKPITITADPTPSPSYNFKIPTSSSSPAKTANTASPFAYSLPNTGFGTSTFIPPNFAIPATSNAQTKFSFNPSTPSVGQNQPGTTEENEEESTEPPEPEKVDHEADAKLTYRCRMGVNKGGKLIKRGPVQVVLKEANEKHQLIIRSDDNLGRLYLNIIWSKMIEMKKNSNKDLTFVCKLNPAMSEIAEGEFVMILLRFDSEADRNDAYDKLGQEQN